MLTSVQRGGEALLFICGKRPNAPQYAMVNRLTLYVYKPDITASWQRVRTSRCGTNPERRTCPRLNQGYVRRTLTVGDFCGIRRSNVFCEVMHTPHHSVVEGRPCSHLARLTPCFVQMRLPCPAAGQKEHRVQRGRGRRGYRGYLHGPCQPYVVDAGITTCAYIAPAVVWAVPLPQDSTIRYICDHNPTCRVNPPPPPPPPAGRK